MALQIDEAARNRIAQAMMSGDPSYSGLSARTDRLQ